jgi:hypothetical protein
VDAKEDQIMDLVHIARVIGLVIDHKDKDPDEQLTMLLKMMTIVDMKKMP